jgi:cyclopropane-fatty-acyl-phospholipid synthase
VHTITISEQQYALAKRRVTDAGPADRVTIELRDYRELPAGEYDAVVSVEMVEAVGERYWPAYFGMLDRMVAPGGRVGLQAIVVPDERLRAARNTYTWIQKYIFPGGVLLSVAEVERQLRRTGLGLSERYAFGSSYARTLRLWRQRFLAGGSDDDTFRRTWEYYLAFCEAGFAAGELDVEQLILTPRPDRPRGSARRTPPG